MFEPTTLRRLSRASSTRSTVFAFLTVGGLIFLLGACPDNASLEADVGLADGGAEADTVTSDVTGAEVADTTNGDAGPQCAAPQALPAVDTSRRKFALSMFHFNIQYVIGGLVVVDEDGETQYLADQKDLATGWDNDRVEDWIVTETFHPVLEIYDANPSWRVTLEMQAYMVEVLAARHPETLALLQKLALSGQAELVSFHYADQLFLAYPREDMQRSIDRTRAVFTEFCLPLSGVVFNQEGQAGEGRQQMLVDNGYTIGVFPKNLWRYVQGDAAWWPYYESKGGTLIVGPGGVDPDSGVDTAWTFFDDGELLTVQEFVNPYLAPLGGRDEARIAEYKSKLAQFQADGYYITTITDYVEHLEAIGLEKKPAPPLLDGTWQPPSTDSIHRWLGGRNQAFVGSNQDRLVRSGNAQARMHVAATQRLFDHAGQLGLAVDDLRGALGSLWDELWHAQVSDSSGVNPWLGEVLFGLRQNARVIGNADQLRASLMQRLGWAHVVIDLLDDTVVELGSLVPAQVLPPASAPVALAMSGDGRSFDVQWFEVADGHFHVTVDATSAVVDPDCDACDYREIVASWPRTIDAIRYSPGLLEDAVVDYDFDAFDFLTGEVYLPLPNGLVGIGKDLWVVKDVRTTHIAARIGPAHATVDFIDRALQVDDAPRWEFHVIQGDSLTALAAANRLNIYPVVQY